ncbi:Structural maintenance of chromosomes protein [Kluyveromyces marxianus]
MKVEELIIDGFKSYATRTVITDWDPQFNAITGLNGSGKSNILDAICFVLGISSMSTVRAQNLQDLIYKRGQAGVTKASVTIVFDNSDPNNSPIGFESHSKISITRQIVLGGVSKYLINGHRAQQQTVLQLFQSVQLNINNPNFLIMQGKITKVLNMKPQEILSLIEEAAGTRMFEDRKEKAERTMAKKETKLQEIRALLSEEIEPKLEKFRNEKRTYLEFQETQSDLENVMKVVNAFEYNYLVNKKAHIEETLVTREAKTQELEETIARLKNEVESLNNDLQALKEQRQREVHKGGKLAELEAQESQISDELSRVETNLNIAKEDMNEEIGNISKLKDNLAKWKHQHDSKKALYDSTFEKYTSQNQNLEKLKTLLKEKQELHSTLTTGISSSGTTANGYNSQLTAIKVKIQNAQVEIKEKEMEMEMLTEELNSNTPKLSAARAEKERYDNEIQNLKQHSEELEKRLNEFGYNPTELKRLKDKERSLKQEYYRLGQEVESLHRKVSSLDFNYVPPSKNFDVSSVKGVVGQLFSLDESNIDSSTALQVCAGGRLFNIVVDNERTASQLLEHGRLRKRVTIIPLNKIASRRINESVINLAKQLAPGKVELALNLIGYEDDVAKAMEFIFGTSFICKDSQTAKLITFNRDIRSRSITLEGDVYDPEGTLSGGSRRSNNTLLLDIQRYNNAASKYKQVEEELNEVSMQIKAEETKAESSKSILSEQNITNHKLKLAEKNAQASNAMQLFNRNNEIQTQLESLKMHTIQLSSLIDGYNHEINTIENDMQEFNKDKGAKLKQLEATLSNMSNDVNRLDTETSKLFDDYQNLSVETEQLSNDISNAENQIATAQEKITELQETCNKYSDIASTKKLELNELQQNLEEERSRLSTMEEELAELETLLKNKNRLLSKSEVELQKLSTDLTKHKNDTQNIDHAIEKTLGENPWLTDTAMVNDILAQNKNINIDQYKKRGHDLAESFQNLRRKVNPKVMSMIESVEKKEAALKTMIKTIEKDKQKIQETIRKLDEYKRDTLIKTWQKVNIDFGNIFSDLLSNSFAKLEPSEGKDVTEGLEVKVKLGKIWKESLVELSGGQRSLIALSLILALLQFKPAPMYILDEVDAALDLSHTQNIGHLIKTRFKGSQFIVVSLKEGMFTNANRVFRTRFQDGTSVVSIM